MSTFDRFTPEARHTLRHASYLAGRAALTELSTDALLMAMTDRSTLRPVLARYGATDLAVRDAVLCWWNWVEAADDRDLLAVLGIDVDEVLRHIPDVDETWGWRLTRSRLRPLRLSLVGPPRTLVLSGHMRKVVEVAMWRARRRGAAPGETDLLFGVLCDHRNRASQVLSELGVCYRTLGEHLNAIECGEAAA